jgi:hypothetical protein
MCQKQRETLLFPLPEETVINFNFCGNLTKAGGRISCRNAHMLSSFLVIYPETISSAISSAFSRIFSSSTFVKFRSCMMTSPLQITVSTFPLCMA